MAGGIGQPIGVDVDFGSQMPPPRAGQVLYSIGDAAVSVRLIAIGSEGCRLPHSGGIQAGEPITLQFLDGVHVTGTVDCIDELAMDIRFDRPVSNALVHYFSPFESPPRTTPISDSFGRTLPPLAPHPKPASGQA